MNRIVYLLTASSALALAACETTGDPNQGGLFGWSETKAQHRQAALQDALYLEEDRGAAARSQTAGLRAQRGRLSRMLSQLDAVDARGGNTRALRSRITRTQSSNNSEEAQVRALESEVRSLRAEYGLLQSRR